MNRVLLILATLPSAANAQDIIIKNNGDEIKSRVLEKTLSEVSYKRYDNLNGPTLTVSNDDIFMIRYENGKKEVFAETDEPAARSIDQFGESLSAPEPSGGEPRMTAPVSAASENEVKYTVLDTADEMPRPAFDAKTYLENTLRYPQYAVDHNITGRVTVKFIVHEDSTISDAYVVKGVGGGCDEEALRVVKNSPLWVPARNGGKAVKVWNNMTINFQLAGTGSKKRKKK